MEQGQGFEESFIRKSLDDRIKRRLERPPNATFSTKLNTQLAQFIIRETQHLPAAPPTTTTPHEGTVGVLPPPARIIAAREQLKGQPHTPLKIFDEITQDGKPVKEIDAVTLHVVTEVNPESMINGQEVDGTVTTLRAVANYFGTNIKVDSKDPKIPDVVAAKVAAVLHLLKRGILGEYSLSEIPVNSQAEAQAAIAAYQEALVDVLKPNPDVTPTDDYTGHTLFNKELIARIEKDRGPKRVAVPIVIEPKQYRNSVKKGDGWHQLYESKTLGETPQSSMDMVLVLEDASVKITKYRPYDFMQPDPTEIDE